MKSQQKERLAALARIAALVSDRAQRPVVAAQAGVAAAKVRADAFAKARTQLASDASDPLQATLMARQAIHLRALHGTAMSDLARLQAELDIRKAAARPAMCKKIALEGLRARQERR